MPLAEAIDLAKHIPAQRENFGYLHVGPEHVGEWAEYPVQ